MIKILTAGAVLFAIISCGPTVGTDQPLPKVYNNIEEAKAAGANVEVRRTSDPATSAGQVATSGSSVQVGAFKLQENVDKNVRKLRSLGYDVRIVSQNGLSAVRVYPKPGQTVQQLRAELRALGYGDATIVK